ncbi:M1 family peptidase [Saccharopolyspora rhizosphaerae]|uniref:Aminopeptidase N n=1 Tax=Saccharopolyspora rhizosphaerae TaxID=2492662 RepID=A0A426JIQ3_9PSEU|nr:M1 family metallopeptidase [Saccharopolyspora rhizosphaerae]RRO13046.1 M1 family peptidase [Saccharopolyspora rhizosphaerae]
MIRRQGLRAVIATCCASAVFAAPALAGSAGPGSPGAGDPYFPGYGNGGYDVSHYDLQLRYQPADDHLQGTATIVAAATQDLTAFNLDFALTAKSVRVNGAPAQFSHDGLELTVTPTAPIAEGTQATVVVEYEGTPSAADVDGVNPWVRTSDGALAVGQPEISAWWFPGNDHPRDKATYDIAVTVPEGTEALSNGVNTRRSTLAGWTTWNWRNTEPTATYLAFMAIGQYEVLDGPGAFGQPYTTAYSEKLGPLTGPAKASIERTPEVVEYLTELFGEYPVSAQGGVVPAEGLSFALENQTRPVYSHKFFQDAANVSVVVHENAHQWFGDSVSVDTWRDIWINEGFASYSEWLWSESHGTGTAQELFDHYYNAYPADDPFWQVPPGEPGAENVFHSAVYDRGAMALHALRNVVGDEVMLDITRTWVAEHRHSTGTVEQFIELAEQKSGKQLDELFNAWLFSKGKPAVSAETGVAASAAREDVPTPPAVAEIDRAHALLHDRG